VLALVIEMKDMENIIIVGSSGHAKVIIDIVQREGKYAILGLLDDKRKNGEKTSDYSVIGIVDELPELIRSHAIQGAIIVIGDNSIPSKVVARKREICPTIQFVNAIHPKSSIAEDVTIAEGTVIMGGVSINPGYNVSEFCILKYLVINVFLLISRYL